MVRIKIKGKLEGFRKYRRRNLSDKKAHLSGFVRTENPEELYIEKLEPFPSIYTRHQYGVFIKGDGTISGGTLRIKEFATAYEASEFVKELLNSETLDKIKTKLFAHPEERIYYTPDDFITSADYDQIYPDLQKYHGKSMEGIKQDWYVFLKNLGFKTSGPQEGCDCFN